MNIHQVLFLFYCSAHDIQIKRYSKKDFTVYICKFFFLSSHSTGPGEKVREHIWSAKPKFGFVFGGGYGPPPFIRVESFDTVDHFVLEQKLQYLGFKRCAINWFASYLQDSMQSTKVGRTVSDQRMVTCGVPQGSILGPLLF